MKFILNKSARIIIYKLLGDLSAIGLIFFALMLVSEAVLPGVITAHVGFTEIILFLALVFLIMHFLGKELGADTEAESSLLNKKSALMLALFFGLIIFNSLLKFGFLAGFIVFIFTSIAAYYIYRITFTDEHSKN